VRPTDRRRIRRGEGDVFRLRAILLGIEPVVWRSLDVSARASLLELHDVIQVAFGHDDSGAHQFVIDGVVYQDLGEGPGGGLTTDAVALTTLGLHLGASIQHSAETHAAPWQHLLTLEQVSERLVGQRLPVCLSGEGASPPDDAGGPVEYRAMLEAFSGPIDADNLALREWLPEDFDPMFIDLASINAELAKVPMHRPSNRDER
jgi:hypothetical protein